MPLTKAGLTLDEIADQGQALYEQRLRGSIGTFDFFPGCLSTTEARE